MQNVQDYLTNLMKRIEASAGIRPANEEIDEVTLEVRIEPLLPAG